MSKSFLRFFRRRPGAVAKGTELKIRSAPLPVLGPWMDAFADARKLDDAFRNGGDVCRAHRRVAGRAGPAGGRRQPGGNATPARRCDAGSASGPPGSTSERLESSRSHRSPYRKKRAQRDPSLQQGHNARLAWGRMTV